MYWTPVEPYGLQFSDPFQFHDHEIVIVRH